MSERLGIYRHIASLDSAAQVDEAADDLGDRFGEVPPALSALLDLARVRIACTTLGVSRVQAGPAAVALTLRDAALGAERFPDARRSEDRLLLQIRETSAAARLERLLARVEEALAG